MDSDRFLLIDEADFILLDGAQKVLNKRVVGLSATAFTGGFVQEREHLEKQKFAVLESNMKGYIHPDVHVKKAHIKEFCTKSAGFAKLVFAKGKAVERFNYNTTITRSRIDCRDLAVLKQLTHKDLFIITDPELMRGVDYRVLSGTMGISLFIMSGFDS